MMKSIYLSFPIEYKGIMKNERTSNYSRLDNGFFVVLISAVLLFGGIFLYSLESAPSVTNLSPATAFLVLPTANESGPAPQATGPWILQFSETDRYSSYNPATNGALNISIGSNLNVIYVPIANLTNFATENLNYDITPYVTNSNASAVSFRIQSGTNVDIYNISIRAGGKRVRFSPFTFYTTTGKNRTRGAQISENRLVFTGPGQGGNNWYLEFNSSKLAIDPVVTIKPSGLVLSPEVPNISINDVVNVSVTIFNEGWGNAEGVTLSLYVGNITALALKETTAGFNVNESGNYTVTFNNIPVPELPYRFVARVNYDYESELNEATRWIARPHPYLLFDDVTALPGYPHRNDAEYLAWAGSITASSAYLTTNYSSPTMAESSGATPGRCERAYWMSINYAFYNAGGQYCNRTAEALYYLGNGSFEWMGELNATGTPYTINNKPPDYDTYAGILQGCGIAYDICHDYIVANTTYDPVIRDKLARVMQEFAMPYFNYFHFGPDGEWGGGGRQGDPDTTTIAQMARIGTGSLAILDYNGQYQDSMFGNGEVWRKAIALDLVNNSQVGDDDGTGQYYRLKVDVTPGGVNRAGGYRYYYSYDFAKWAVAYSNAFNYFIGDEFPIVERWMTAIVFDTNIMGQQTNRVEQITQFYTDGLLSATVLPEQYKKDAMAWYNQYSVINGTGRGYRAMGSNAEYSLFYDKDAVLKEPRWVDGFLNASGDYSTLRDDVELLEFKSGYGDAKTSSPREQIVLSARFQSRPLGPGMYEGHNDNMIYDISGKGTWFGGDSGDLRFFGNDAYKFTDHMPEAYNTLLINNLGLRKYGNIIYPEDMKNKAYLTNSLTSDYLDFAELYVQPEHIKNKTAGGTYCCNVKKGDINWTRSFLMPNNEYFIVVDEAEANESKNWDSVVHFSGTERYNGVANDFNDNYVYGNLTIDGEQLNNSWWHGNYSNSSADVNYPAVQNITWDTLTERGVAGYDPAGIAEMNVYLLPVANLTRSISPSFYGAWPSPGDKGSSWSPYVKSRQNGKSVKYVAVHYLRNSTDPNPTFTQIELPTGYAFKMNHTNIVDYFFVSNASNTTASSLSSDANMAYSRYNSGLKNFFMRNGSWLSYNGQPKVSLSSKLPVFALEYTGGNISFTLGGSGAVDISFYSMNPSGTYFVTRDGAFYTNWTLNGAVLQISTPLSAHKFEVSDSMPAFADLQVLPGNIALSNSTLIQGTPVNVSALVSNIGTKDAEGVQVVLLQNSQQVASSTITLLPLNSSSLVVFSWTPPAAGTFNLSISADPSNSIPELSESNNLATTQVSVSQSPPDLAISSSGIWLSSSSLTEGGLLSINATVQNLGGTNASGFSVLFSVDSVPKSTALLSVNAGSSSNASFNWTSVSGTHNLSFFADSSYSVLESDESNNNASVLVSVSSQPPSGGGGGGGGGGGSGGGFAAPSLPKASTKKPLLVIDFFEDAIQLTPGVVSRIKFYVWNLGTMDLFNVSLFTAGIDSSWLAMPQSIDRLPMNSSKEITVEIYPPPGSSGMYYLSIAASVSNVTERKTASVSVFSPSESAPNASSNGMLGRVYQQATGAISQEIGKSLAVQDATGTRKYIPVAAGVLLVASALLLARPALARRMKAADAAPQDQ